MQDTSNKPHSEAPCSRRFFFHVLLTSFYTLALVALPFGFHHATGQLTATTAIADDDGGGDDGGGSGGSDAGGSGDDGSGDDGAGGDGFDDGSDGFDDGNDGFDDGDREDDSRGDFEGDDDGRDDRSGDGSGNHDSPDSNRADGGRFDFGDLDNLEPMSPEEESDAVGHWN
jgi:hypothetical protein